MDIDKDAITDGDEVTLTVTDSNGLPDSCATTVIVDQITCCEDDCTCKLGRKLQLCHVPSGNPNNEHTICVGRESLTDHLSHGDYCCECLS